MKRARVAASAAVVIVAAAVVTTGFLSSRGERNDVDRAARGGATTGDAPPAEPPPSKPLTAERTPAETAAPAEAGARSLSFDLRGPDDQLLVVGALFVESERARGSPRHDSRWLAWRRTAPAVALPPWARWLSAEADSVDDDLVSPDLASETIDLEADGAGAAGTAPRVVRLARRPGIFGRVTGLAATTTARVAWLERSAVEGSAHPADELARRGKLVPLRRNGDAAAYEIYGLEPGAYVVGLRDEHLEVVEPATSVDVVDRMVRVDLAAHLDASASLLVHLVGLSEEDDARAEFAWIDGAAPTGSWTALRRENAGAGAWRVTPIGAAARATMRRLLAGQLEAREHCALALVRENEVVAAQPLENGQHEATFTIGADANLTVRLEPGPDRSARRRVDVVPAAALALLAGPPAEREGGGVDGETVTRTFRRLAPGDFVLQVWAPLKSSLHHGEVWWPIERRPLTLHAGDQEVTLAAPALHPLTVRFDRARFGADAKVQLMLRGYSNRPRYAEPDERGVARFDDVPGGDYTVAVIGDEAGQVDCTIPGTSELTVELTRREK